MTKFNEWKLEKKYKGKSIILITPEEYSELPIGTELIAISGKEMIKSNNSMDFLLPNNKRNPNYIDTDTQFGFIAYGLKSSLKDIDSEIIKEIEESND